MGGGESSPAAETRSQLAAGRAGASLILARARPREAGARSPLFSCSSDCWGGLEQHPGRGVEKLSRPPSVCAGRPLSLWQTTSYGRRGRALWARPGWRFARTARLSLSVDRRMDAGPPGPGLMGVTDAGGRSKTCMHQTGTAPTTAWQRVALLLEGRPPCVSQRARPPRPAPASTPHALRSQDVQLTVAVRQRDALAPAPALAGRPPFALPHISQQLDLTPPLSSLSFLQSRPT